jgi:hypothetical protein
LNKFEIYYVNEEHNHSFVDESDMHLLSANRELTYTQQQAIAELGAINIGPVRAFNIMRTMCGGFDRVGATKVDFKNFKKDVNLYIGEYDAEMMIERLTRKKEYNPNFSFDYHVDENGVLKGVFWADEICKRSYFHFGDVLSFDATYRRNK